MYSLAFLAVCSFIIALILTPLFRNWAIRLGFVDAPGDPRKIHERPVPRTGGVAIFVTYLAALGLLFALPLHAGRVLSSELILVVKLLPAALIVFATGLADDLIHLKPWQKLAGQCVAALVAYFCGVQIVNLGALPIGHWFGFPITILWLIGCANAFNLIDGMDGLASGVGLFATITALIAGLLHGNLSLAIAVAPLAGALLGFLRYNFNPASIFLGDCGSLFIGFMLGCFGVLWSQKSATVLGMTAPLIALSLPLLDTFLAIARRFLRRQPIFGADRRHIHHRLLDKGITTRRTVLVLYAFCGLAAALSLLQSVFDHSFGGAFIVLFCAAAWLGIQQLGYVEFNVAGKMLLDGTVRTTINAELCLQSFEARLAAAADTYALWTVLRNAAPEFGFSYLQMKFQGQMFSGYASPQPSGCNCRVSAKTYPEQGTLCPECWAVRIPLSRLDYVDFVRRSGVSGLSSVVAPFVELVRRILQRKLAELELAAAPSPSTLALAAAVGRSVAPAAPSAPQALRPHASRATPAP
jgi:UDP-GlcNAc:undecaprenyl-phosphate GlcNAc-1-phosphate transferase